MDKNSYKVFVLKKDHKTFLGEGLQISYGVADSPFGLCFMAICEMGICYLGFPDKENLEKIQADLFRVWPKANFKNDNCIMKETAEKIFRDKAKNFQILLKGTDFQIQVWQALLKIDAGKTLSYGELANTIGLPKAYRAVGTAVGKNPISYLIPCHRVIQKSGALGGYLWGMNCKNKLLEVEGIRN